MDMTRGKPLRLILQFALPLMLSSALQMLYTLFDGVIVGQLLGGEAFAAVGSAATPYWFSLSLVQGLSFGFGVALSQRFGAKDEPGFRRAFAMSGLIALAAGLLLSILGVLFVRPLLVFLNTPEALIANASEYLRVLWLGIPLAALYNTCAAALRSMGDSRTPLMALGVSSVLSIVLSWLLIAVIPMGVAGAALATLLAQGVAFILCLVSMRRSSCLPKTGVDFRPRAATIRELLRLSVPPMLSNGSTAIGEMAVQAAINGYGIAFVAGMAASRRYFPLLTLIGGGLEGAVAVFVGQNTGADEPARVIRGTNVALGLGALTAIVATALTVVFAEPMIRLFLPGGSAETVSAGVNALRVGAAFLIALYPLFLCRAAIQGGGNAVIPMLSGFVELGLRLLCVWWMPSRLGKGGLYFIDGVTWIGALLLLIPAWLIMRKRLERLTARSALPPEPPALHT